MNNTANEVLEFVKENDVKFIWLNFCDLFGSQKSISIMADELESAFLNGVSFDAYAVRGFKDVKQSDLLLFPDPATLMVLPWRPGPGRVVRFYCDIKNPDGSLYAHDSRNILKQVSARCDKMGYVCKVGPECEFYLFKTDENGDPTEKPLDNGGYLDMDSVQLDKLLEQMARQGLKGIEAYYTYNTEEQTSELIRLAKKHNLLITGGSDFHGSFKPDIEIGSGKGALNVPYSLLAALRQAGRERA